ncbi:hypothetical protein N7467_003900 [Penicillium canescens]|nr:hypothetical protein N7467_003900 [Penicillium canescens]
MSQIISRPSWLTVAVLALLAVSTVNAAPVRATNQEMEAEQPTEVESRSPRLIPDTEGYVHDLLKGLGLDEPKATPTGTPTTASMEAEQGKPENEKATPATHITYSSSVSYTPTYGSNGAGFTDTVKHEESNNKPFENVQISPGWGSNKKLTFEDLPRLFDAMYREVKHQVSNMINSSDEIELDGYT